MKINKSILTGMFLLTLVVILAAARNTAPESDQGIQFFKGTWSEAVKKAKAENKPIFLDVYATWCGPCRQLKRNTFSDKEVGEYFNSNFINVSLDGEQTEGRALMEKYNLRAYPSLLIIDSNEAAQIIEPGFKSPNKLIDFGKQGLERLKD